MTIIRFEPDDQSRFTQTYTNLVYPQTCSCEWFTNEFIRIQLYKWNPATTDDNNIFVKYLNTSWMSINLQIANIRRARLYKTVCPKMSKFLPEMSPKHNTSSEQQLPGTYSDGLLMQPEHAWNWLLASQIPESCCTSLRSVDRIGYSRSFELYGFLIGECSLGFSSLLEPVRSDRAGMWLGRYALCTGTR